MEKIEYSNITCILQLSMKDQKANGKNFETVMANAIDESLGSFESLDKQGVYLHLEKSFKIRKQEIPSKIEEFVEALEQMFGIGARLIEIKIIKMLHKKIPEFKYTPKKGAVMFANYAAHLRDFLLQSA